MVRLLLGCRALLECLLLKLQAAHSAQRPYVIRPVCIGRLAGQWRVEVDVEGEGEVTVIVCLVDAGWLDHLCLCGFCVFRVSCVPDNVISIYVYVICYIIYSL